MEMLTRTEKYANAKEAWARHGELLSNVPLKKDDDKNKNGWKREHCKNNKRERQSRTTP